MGIFDFLFNNKKQQLSSNDVADLPMSFERALDVENMYAITIGEENILQNRQKDIDLFAILLDEKGICRKKEDVIHDIWGWSDDKAPVHPFYDLDDKKDYDGICIDFKRIANDIHKIVIAVVACNSCGTDSILPLSSILRPHLGIVKWHDGILNKEEIPLNLNSAKDSVLVLCTIERGNNSWTLRSSYDTFTTPNVLLDKHWLTLKEQILVIGMGGTGSNIIEKMAECSSLSADYLRLGFDFDVYNNGNVKNRIMLNETDPCGTELTYNTRFCYSTENFDKLVMTYRGCLNPIISQRPNKVIIVAGLGGTNGFGLISVVKYLKKHEINILPVVTMPLLFESEGRRIHANIAKKQLKSLCDNARIISLDDLVRQNKKLTVCETLHIADKEIIKTIENISSDSMCLHGKELFDKNKTDEQSRNNLTKMGKLVCGITPVCIESLGTNEVFVFGSNLQGMHSGGAARTAYKKFGADMGNGVGMQGQSYAIPTMQGGVETIKPYVDDFIVFARSHKELHFLVTRIGCGIAGFKDSNIAPLFAECVTMSNVSLPSQFISFLTGNNEIIEEYGQIQTLCDLIKTLNDSHHYTNANDVYHDMADVMQHYTQRGTISEATRRLVYNGLISNGDIFINGHLSVNRLRNKLLEKLRNLYNEALSEPMNRRDVAKFIGLLLYMNDFRRYTSSEQIREDFLNNVFDGITSCGDFSKSPLNDRMFYGAPIGGYAYPTHAFFRALQTLWSEISTEGVLDNNKLQAKMIDEYQNAKQTEGLDQLVKEHYLQDGPCHPEVYFPKDDFYGPVLVDGGNGIYIESCGEGKGPNSSSDYYEFQLLKNLIANDPKYICLDEDSWETYIVPKADYSLPVFGPLGKLHFTTQNEKEDFIKERIRNSQRH